MSKNKHIGSSLDDFLAEEGLLDEVNAIVAKRAIAWQIVEAMKQANLTKSAMAKRMHTSRSALDRVLDESDTSLTLDTLSRAAAALGRKLKVEIVGA